MQHLNCYTKFVRENQIDCDVRPDPTNICLFSVIKELQNGCSRGNLYSMSTVWERYCELLSAYDVNPGNYRSNRFKDKLIQQGVDNFAEFVPPLNRNSSLLIVPKGVALETLREYIANDTHDKLEECSMSTVSFETDNLDTALLSWLFRVAV